MERNEWNPGSSSVNRDEATSLSLDEIILLQSERKRRDNQDDLPASFPSSGARIINSNKKPTNSSPTVVCDLASVLQPSCSYQRQPQNDLREKLVTTHMDTSSSCDEEEDSLVDQLLIDELTDRFFGAPKESSPALPQLSDARGGGNSIFHKQHSLAQNHPRMVKKTNFVNNNTFKRKRGPLGKVCQKPCCADRCRAQKRLQVLISQLKVKQRHHPRMPSFEGAGSGLKRSSSCNNLVNSPSSSCWDFSPFQRDHPVEHRSRSRFRGPPANQMGGFRGRSRSRNRSRSRSRSQSRNKICNHVVLCRRDQILSAEIQREIASIAKKSKAVSPMKYRIFNADSWVPVIHHTFVSMTTRFGNYYV